MMYMSDTYYYRHAQQCSELTRQRDSATSELESSRSRIEVMEQAFHQQETSLANMVPSLSHSPLSCSCYTE